MKGKWLYDIFLNEVIVGNQGDEEFETKEEALADAHDYIISELADEWKCQVHEFDIDVYQANY